MNDIQKPKLPYGTCNFKYIAEQNYLYIDKTKYIETMERLGERYILFIRPRRFGKSLFVSILDHYYNILHKDKFDKYFGKYYIGQNPTPLKNSYLVLTLDFSGIPTETVKEGFLEKIRLSIKTFLHQYRDLLNLSTETETVILSKNDPAILMQYFLNEIKLRTNINLFILIDEYDHFANEFLSFDPSVFNKITTGTGFVRKFYETLKEGTKSLVERIFITGVSPITLDSFTSGFNISKNLSVQEKFNEMFGFTKNEVLFLIKETIIDCPKLQAEDIYNELEILYNGYLFHKDATEKMFNSDMVLYYLTEINNCKKPESVIDKNFASDYQKIKKPVYDHGH